MEKGVKQGINLYHMRGLRVVQLNNEHAFAYIEEIIIPVRLNVVAVEEHAGEVKRSTRTVKECTRWHVYRCPYTRYLKIMIVECTTKIIKDLNQILAEK